MYAIRLCHGCIELKVIPACPESFCAVAAGLKSVTATSLSAACGGEGQGEVAIQHYPPHLNPLPRFRGRGKN
jgi:hypothetical protein